MNKKVTTGLFFLSTLFYSSVVSACLACWDYQYHSGDNYSDGYSKQAHDFDSKRRQLNELYDQGVSDGDERVKALTKELDSLSEQMRNEERSNRHRPYSNQGHRYHNCW